MFAIVEYNLALTEEVSWDPNSISEHRLGSNATEHLVGAFSKLEGSELIDDVILVDQSPIGRTPRSNPATYTGAFTPIRDWFTDLPESKIRGYKVGRFSFSSKQSP